MKKLLGVEVVGSEAVGGGCIADARRVDLADGRRVFCKRCGGGRAAFLQEANGLRELAKPGGIRVPAVLEASEDQLVLEWVETGRPGRGFMEAFGRRFAEMHRYTAERFGFYEDNVIGATPQANGWCEDSGGWAEFWWIRRMEPQLRMAEQAGFATEAMSAGFAKLEKAIPDVVSGSEEPPTLLHGDLWSGNFMVGESGEAVLIDPAVYYGHREADLAMTRMFGGFGAGFYAAYEEAFPLAEGHERRDGLYRLYHVMNHLNLFGTSYRGQAMSLLGELVG